MGGAGSSGVALSGEDNAEPGTFLGKLFKRSETIQRPFLFACFGVFLSLIVQLCCVIARLTAA